MSRPLSPYVVALHDALENIQRFAAEIEPDSQEFQVLRNDLYRSGEILAAASNLYAQLSQEYDLQTFEQAPKQGTQGTARPSTPIEWEPTQPIHPASPPGLPPRAQSSPSHPPPPPQSRLPPPSQADSHFDHPQDSDNEEDGPPASKSSPDTSNACDLAKRVEQLMACHPNEILLHTERLIYAATQYRDGSNTQSTTNTGCSQLFNLYRIPDAQDIQAHLDGEGIPYTNWSALKTFCKKADRNTSTEDKLKAFSQLSLKTDTGSAILNWVFRIINTVIQLKFAIEWNRLSKSAKSKYFNASFEQAERLFVEKNRHTTNYKKHTAARRAVSKRQHEKIVTARNRTLKLYQMFGANVVAHPLFQLSTKGPLPINGKNLYELTSHIITHRVAILSEYGFLDALREEDPDISEIDGPATEEYLEQCHQNTTSILKHVVAHVAGTDLGKYVDHFLKSKDTHRGIVIPD